MDTLWQDLRYGLRMLLKRPGFTSIVVLTLALGIGGNTTIFSLVNAILLRPLSYHEPERLFTIWETIPKLRHMFPSLPVSAPHFLEWRKQNTVFEEIAIISPTSVNLTSGGEPERLGAARVSANIFSLLGVGPQLGRVFLEGEDQPGRDGVVVISNLLWRQRFQADPAVIGKPIMLDGKSFVVIGVLPRGFPFPRGRQLHQYVAFESQTDLWMPIVFTPSELAQLGEFDHVAIGRLKNGVTAEQAHAELNLIQGRISQQAPELTALGAFLLPLQEALVGNVRQGLVLLLAAVSFFLLIVCVNVANLLLARAPLRRREIAVRAALGAGRGRLLTQMLIENLLLALLGGALGVLLALWGVEVLATRIPVDLPRLEEVGVDSQVLLYALLVSLITGVIFGLWPALNATRLKLSEALKESGHTFSEGLRGRRLRGILVALEVSLSVLLLVGAGLLLRSFVRLMNVDKGFETEHVIVADLSLPPTKYSEGAKQREFYRRLLDQVEALPGVLASGVINTLPLSRETNVSVFTVEGAPPLPVFERPVADFRLVSPGYFGAMRIPLRKGRVFDESDRQQVIAVISEKMAHRLWPGQDPIGKRIRHGGEDASPIQIVGVVGDIRNSALDKEPAFVVYQPYWQHNPLAMSLVTRTATNPQAIASVLRREIRKLEPELPTPEMRAMDQVVSDSVSRRRFQMLLLSAFACLALVLAAVGIYGVMSSLVTQRTHEIGIRLALGAQPRDILKLVVGQGLSLALVGVGIGLAAALALTRLMSSLLYGVGATDTATFVGIALLQASVALLASYIPARRAAKVDPMVALRYE